MALHKEPYGLVYNDDGSLCVTLRNDDKPFEGVTSFAVEEGTENVVADYQDEWHNYSTGVVERELITEGQFKGWYKVHATHTGYAGLVGFLRSVAVNPDETYTWSLDMVVVKGNARPYLIGSLGLGAFSKVSEMRWAKTWTNNYDSVKNLAAYFQILKENGDPETADVDVDVVFYYRYYQVEKKPFATSFVDGSRTTGRFYIPLENLGFDPANDDWVIAYWSKPSQRDTYKTSTIGQFTTDNSQGYIWWGLKSTTEELAVWAVLSDGSVVYPRKTVNIDCNSWHFEVMLKSGDELKYYFDGEEAISIALSQPLKPFTFGLMLGGRQSSGGLFAHNMLLSNIYIGKAKVGDKLIWDDDYIKQLYQAKRPFSVPPKMPVGII